MLESDTLEGTYKIANCPRYLSARVVLGVGVSMTTGAIGRAASTAWWREIWPS